MQKADFASSILHSRIGIFTGFCFLNDFFRDILRALYVLLKFAGLSNPTVDVGCGFTRKGFDFILHELVSTAEG